jgi:hypothetical protein
VELGYRIWKSGVKITYNERAVTYHNHGIELKDYVRRQLRLGKAAAILYKKHPELLNFLNIPRVTSPEVRHRFYQSVLDYYYFMGLQDNLSAGGDNSGLIPLADRLKNWASTETQRISKKSLDLETEVKSLLREIRRRDEETIALNNRMASLGKEIERRDRLIEKFDQESAKRHKMIEALTTKNQEKYYRIVELEKFELRVKSSIIFKIYNFFTRRPRKK